MDDLLLFEGTNITDSDDATVARLYSSILARIDAGGTLEMESWHSTTCATTHCVAGWTVTLAGEAGAELDRRWGPEIAATMIHRASCPGVPRPNYHATNAAALAYLRHYAALEV